MPEITTAGIIVLTFESPEWAAIAKLVMPGLVPGIHVLTHVAAKDVHGRDKPRP
jgi:hypothetical protein